MSWLTTITRFRRRACSGACLQGILLAVLIVTLIFNILFILDNKSRLSGNSNSANHETHRNVNLVSNEDNGLPKGVESELEKNVNGNVGQVNPNMEGALSSSKFSNINCRKKQFDKSKTIIVYTNFSG